MPSKIALFKNGAYVTFEQVGYMWRVAVRAPNGEIHDKIICDDYREALAYRRAFISVGKNL